mgnify:CR=1 FL=1
MVVKICTSRDRAMDPLLFLARPERAIAPRFLGPFVYSPHNSNKETMK